MSNPMRRQMQDFVQDKTGTVAIIFALTSVMVAAVAGASVDYGRAVRAKAALSAAGDAAALAAAATTGVTDAERITVASAFFNANVTASGLDNVTPNVTSNNGTVTVSAELAQPTVFMGLLGIETLRLKTESAAARDVEGTACLLALNSSAAGAIHVQGTNKLTAENCWAWANSNNPAAITGVGTALAQAAGFCAVGAAVENGNYVPTPETGCYAISDPYATLVPPQVGSCSFNNRSYGKGTHTLEPGVYCGGLELKTHATATLKPGVYIIKNGPLTVQAGSSASGNGVVFYFTGANSTLQIKGGADIDVQAPAAGSLAGMLFVQDRNASIGVTTQIQGGGRVKMNGVLYMPTQIVEIAGNGNLNLEAKMFAMVADRFVMRGNGTLSLKIDYQGAGLPNVLPPIPASAKLVR